jgi:hypothetical protein
MRTHVPSRVHTRALPIPSVLHHRAAISSDRLGSSGRAQGASWEGVADILPAARHRSKGVLSSPEGHGGGGAELVADSACT